MSPRFAWVASLFLSLRFRRGLERELADYLPIVTMLGLSSIFALASIWISSKAGPSRPSPAKEAPYESGITPLRSSVAQRFPVKFYLIAMLFIIFDIELIFFFPWAVIFRELHLLGLIEMAVFVALLLVAYFYILRSGALDWGDAERKRPRVPGGSIRDPAALRGPGEGGAGLEELVAARPAPDAPMPPDKAVV